MLQDREVVPNENGRPRYSNDLMVRIAVPVQEHLTLKLLATHYICGFLHCFAHRTSTNPQITTFVFEWLLLFIFRGFGC